MNPASTGDVVVYMNGLTDENAMTDEMDIGRGLVQHHQHRFSETSYRSLDCWASMEPVPIIVDLRNISLRLTAYSLHLDPNKKLCGSTDWNFEGSQDGEAWTVLHAARNDRHFAKHTHNIPNSHTWTIDSPCFYRYFRFIGSGEDYERAAKASDCLHFVDLELYGDVHEE